MTKDLRRSFLGMCVEKRLPAWYPKFRGASDTFPLIVDGLASNLDTERITNGSWVFSTPPQANVVLRGGRREFAGAPEERVLGSV